MSKTRRKLPKRRDPNFLPMRRLGHRIVPSRAQRRQQARLRREIEVSRDNGTE